jgi:hypothetical protein
MLNKQTAMERARDVLDGHLGQDEIADALLAIQAETLEAAAKATCMFCARGVPFAPDAQPLDHIKDNGHLAICHASAIRRLKETPEPRPQPARIPTVTLVIPHQEPPK